MDGNKVVERSTDKIVFEGISHWDACAVLVAIPTPGDSSHG